MASIDSKIARRQQKRAVYKKICTDYLKLKEQYPDEPPFALFETLAERYRKVKPGIYPGSSMGVRDVIVRYKLYQPKRRGTLRKEA